ncbi:MAG: deoxyribose-phosphate aldolase [Anaerobutyricum sp.]|nr:deoxyribose-phosphate aldolase [Eubacterium sp.]MDY6046774.1 deoxyribose-phosphate aldolase [Anaerobutyricum sp.]
MVDLSKYDQHSIGKLFDFSVLPKNTNEASIREGCRIAIKYNCASFYSSSPFWTPVVKEELAGSDVLVAAAINFPFGTSSPAVKAFETEEAIRLGAQSVDTVINVGALRDKNYKIIKEELKLFKEAAGDAALTKVILETCFLTDDEIRAACEMIAEAGIDYAKTSSGQFEGPTMEQFLVMKETLKNTPVKLKVAGVKFPRPQNAYAFIIAGADLIGTRAADQIIDALPQLREIGLVPTYKPD